MIDLTITRGDERALAVAVLNPNGTPANLAGKRVLWAAKRHPSEPAVISKSSTAGGITVTDAANGLATVTILPADTSGYADTTILLWDMQVDNNPGQPITVAFGTLRITPDIA